MKQHQAILGIKQEYLSDICAALTLYSEAIRELYAQKVKRIALIEGDLYACHTIRARFCVMSAMIIGYSFQKSMN